ncbi:MAG: response regulator, partial [Bacteroidales bacterium]|nr:response regulator [Bacteroidales bacterium]
MSEKSGNILIIDDNEDILFALKLLLKPFVESITTLNNPESIPDVVSKQYFDMVLLDMNFSKDAISGQEGFYWLEKILGIEPQSVVVFITAYGDAEKAVERALIDIDMLHPAERHHGVGPEQQPPHHPQPVRPDLIAARIVTGGGHADDQ